MKQTQTTQSQTHSKQLIHQSQKISLGKVIIEYTASALVLLSALLPFANNIAGNLWDTSITFTNKSGKGTLDLDDIIFFSSWPVTLSFLLIGLTFGARPFTKISVIFSLLIQYVVLIQFIFFDKNHFNIAGLIGSVLTFGFLVWGLYKLYLYYTSILLVDKFKETTLERYSYILNKKNQDQIK